MRRGICLLLLALVTAYGAKAEEMRLEEIRERLAHQDARVTDMESKIRYQSNLGTGEGLVSLRKNATVTIGGLITTGMYYQRYKTDGVYAVDADGNFSRANDGYRRRGDAKSNSLEVTDAELYVQIDVNEHFDAFLYMDLHNAADNDSYGVAKAYYVRWKNVCESGFGLKVGRDRLPFGDDGVGFLDSWACALGGDGMSWVGLFEGYPNTPLSDGLGPVPLANHWKFNGSTQITPYWEGLDGKLSAEVSFFQTVYNDGARMTGMTSGATYTRVAGNYTKYRSRNYGVGSMSARVTYAPVEGLQLRASAINFHSNGSDEITHGHAKNNTATSLSATYTPCFLDKLTVWGQWIHGWNVQNFEDLDSDVVNYGASWSFTEQLSVFMQGDYLKSRYKYQDANSRGTGWAAYGGVMYELPYGVLIEAGWRHEDTKFKENGVKVQRFKGDTIYANIGFEF